MPFWHIVPALLSLLSLAAFTVAETDDPVLSNERVVFQLDQGDIEFAFFPEVAPVTSAHIFQLVQLGLYESNQIFRVDKGFVAQTSDVVSGRLLALNPQQQEFASKQVPLEVKEGVKHHEGVLSMGRYEDPNTGTSSFSMLLGDAPHLDMQYTIFAKIVNPEGMAVLHKLEKVETKQEGIFVMPLKRITITGTYWYILGKPMPGLTLPGDTAMAIRKEDAGCSAKFKDLKQRFLALAEELETIRKKSLP
mmetsp:Transcript_4018/g.6599  ORF Transcript_4018/g.6599 Transcript_4018/m.6599 type:complete len:249 (+) Transcript_4018:97-843(+)|eukprot:CAMPEP_0119101210 /NCGR_PEP_ID=MMETSP1180-20130426/326_1 /TAXON_ID=3052 ORGANISM="Chlamydomonas cf sp, Strain CCMP681" /NCGR_SAMPLE_ID=MMETSP1180 /ASSEMBLY_ACC=CAM_ASM_000741 /LENGTH=248 /DNA_ID=CAMNT_0007085295 /DNA_START=91 /DNA_END=837 /DNA_ORIENTATION=+